jgi:hypothetical protein
VSELSAELQARLWRNRDYSLATTLNRHVRHARPIEHANGPA